MIYLNIRTKNPIMNSLFALKLILIALFPLEACRSQSHSGDPPNILFIISDDQSWMHCGAYGDKGIKTPSIDQLAREGVLFQYAFASAPSCMASRSAILTGRNMWELKEAGNLIGQLRSDFEIFPSGLRNAGYQLAATGKTWGPGVLKGYLKRNGSEDTDRKYNATSTELLTGKAFESIKNQIRTRGINKVNYAANFEVFLKNRDTSKPFFFWLGTQEPHQNYDVGAWKKAGKSLNDARVPGSLPNHPVVQGEFLDYAMEIEYIDNHIGKAMKSLADQKLLENTVIVFTSDHGNPMPRSKCNLYDTGTRVPLIIRYPKKYRKGRVIQDIVNLIDLAPTFLEIGKSKIPEKMSGRSLLKLLETRESGIIDSGRDFVVTAFERHVITRRDGQGYPMRCIRTHKYAYIKNYEPDRWPAGDPDFYSSNRTFFGDVDSGATKALLLEKSMNRKIHPYYLLAFGRRPSEELYDMISDPDQLTNLANNSKYTKLKNQLKRRMNQYLKKTGDPRQNGKTPWDQYPFMDQTIFEYPNWKTQGMADQPIK